MFLYRPEFPFVIVILFWGSFFGIWLLGNALRENHDERLLLKSISWPQTQGSVTSSRIVWAHLEVAYEFPANGQRFTGSYTVGMPATLPTFIGMGVIARATKNFLGDYPVGTKLLVRYNPLDPTESVLYSRDPASPKP